MLVSDRRPLCRLDAAGAPVNTYSNTSYVGPKYRSHSGIGLLSFDGVVVVREGGDPALYARDPLPTYGI